MDDIYFKTVGRSDNQIGLIILNRPQALNALSHAMIRHIHKQLQDWAKVASIKAVFMRQSSPGRAFCAGGDIRAIYQEGLKDPQTAVAFFRDEYSLNNLIHQYRRLCGKPIISLIDGAWMGGGVGISLHGSLRIASENTIFSMPEANIGFFPDVGTSWVLARLEDGIGPYLALTTAWLNAADCLALGLATHLLPASAHDELMDHLEEKSHSTAFSGKKIRSLITAFCKRSNADGAFLAAGLDDKKRSLIAKVFQHDRALFCHQRLSEHPDNPLAQEWSQTMDRLCPLSLEIAVAAQRKARRLSFKNALEMEFHLSQYFTASGANLYEGVRALIIDKDKNPRWNPAHLDDITPQMLRAAFASQPHSLF